MLLKPPLLMISRTNLIITLKIYALIWTYRYLSTLFLTSIIILSYVEEANKEAVSDLFHLRLASTVVLLLL